MWPSVVSASVVSPLSLGLRVCARASGSYDLFVNVPPATERPLTQPATLTQDTIDKSLWSPVIDGVVLFDTPVSLLRGDKIAKVPILLGTNRDEGSTFTGNLSGTGDGLHTPDTFYNAWLYSKDQVDFNGSPGYYATMLLQNESQFIVWATDMFGTNASKVLTDMYRPGTKSDLGVPIQDWWWSVSAVVGDFVLTCPARRTVRTLEKLGRNESAYVFLFDHTPKLSVNQAATDLWGAFHGSEVPFVWYDLFELATEEERQLSAAMVQVTCQPPFSGRFRTPCHRPVLLALPGFASRLAGCPPFSTLHPSPSDILPAVALKSRRLQPTIVHVHSWTGKPHTRH
jgi:hypothetical protein